MYLKKIYINKIFLIYNFYIFLNIKNTKNNKSQYINLLYNNK